MRVVIASGSDTMPSAGQPSGSTSTQPRSRAQTTTLMPIPVTQGVPSLLFRRSAYERADLSRAALDARLGLTDAEFRVEGDLVVLGPIYDVDSLGALVDELEANGLTYFDDFFELSGSWPEWLVVSATAPPGKELTPA